MKQTWFTCSRCGHQFKGSVNHNHHCPQCKHYPSLVGKVKLQPQQPRITRQFPPPTRSGTLAQFTNSDQPTQPGQFTQAGWPSQTVPQRRTGRRNLPTTRKGKVGAGCVGIIVLVLVLACCGAISNAFGGTSATATPTPDVLQGIDTTDTSQATTTQPSPTPTTKPQPTSTKKPKPTATPTKKPGCRYPAVDNNPWCYTFTNTGKYIYNPPADFCTYFNCIASFWNGSGYVVECADSTYSLSGGNSGACSHHGGENRPLYAP